jgi:phenylpyruvate tautomerase PptA (4-oxalocrotonate tautomerase family)
MPVAKVYVPQGILTPDHRREIVKGIHEVIVGVEKHAADFPTYVLINEVPPTTGAGPATSTRLEPDHRSRSLTREIGACT